MIDVRVLGTRELQLALLDIDRRTDRATKWAVREAGRKAKSASRAAAPVLKANPSAGVVTRRQVKRGGLAINPNAPVAGLLRSSIASGKQLHGAAGTFAVRVAPRGDRVHLYSGKAELAHHYMQAGYDAAHAAFPAIAARAWLHSTRR